MTRLFGRPTSKFLLVFSLALIVGGASSLPPAGASAGAPAVAAKRKCKKVKKASSSKKKKCKKKKKNGSGPAIGTVFKGDPNVAEFKVFEAGKVYFPHPAVRFRASAVAPDCQQLVSTGELAELIDGSNFGSQTSLPDGKVTEVNGHFVGATSAEGTWRVTTPGPDGNTLCDTGQVPFKVRS